MVGLVSVVLPAFLTILLHGCEENSECPHVQTQSDFHLDDFISRPWFIQQQMETEYLPKSKNFCVNAMYTKKKKKNIWGYTIAVRNRAQEADGTESDSGDLLCAYGYDKSDSAKLAVAPCWLPTAFSGEYWVLAHNETAGYALVSGGQPTLATPLGCRTGSGTNDAGLWIFTREAQPDFTLVEEVREIAQSQGFDLSVLNNVSHAGCKGEPYQ
jgi:lipocalin